MVVQVAKNVKKIVGIFILFSIFLILTFHTTYAEATIDYRSSITGEDNTDVDNERKMTDEEILENYDDFKGMLNEIFSYNDDPTGSPIFNPSAFITSLSDAVIAGIKDFSSSSLFSIFIGLGIFFMFINFMLNLDQSKIMNEKLTNAQISKNIIIFILSVYFITHVCDIIIMFLTIFRWVLDEAIGYKDTLEVVVQDQETFINQSVISVIRNCGADRISSGIGAITGLISGNREEGIVDNIMNNIAIMAPRIQFMIPWILALVGKFGCLFIIAKNAYDIFMHSMFAPIAFSDIGDNIKQSRGLRYLKTILSFALQQSVIICAMVASNVIMKSYVSNTFENIAEDTFSCAMVFAVLQLAKTGAIASISGAVAKAAIGG